MTDYDNSNSGALFENERRATEKHPHLRGSCTIKTPDGELVEYWVSAWQKTSKKGDDFFSLSFELKEDQQKRKVNPAAKSSSLFKKREEHEKTSKNKTTSQADLDDEVPF